MPEGYDVEMLRTANHKQPIRLQNQSNNFFTWLLPFFYKTFPKLLWVGHSRSFPVWYCPVQIHFCSNKLLKFLIWYILFFHMSLQLNLPTIPITHKVTYLIINYYFLHIFLSPNQENHSLNIL